MGYIESVYAPLGLALSIIGLAIQIPHVFLFKQHLRYFDHLQLIVLYWIILASTQNTFGAHIEDSWAKFIPNFLKFCTDGDLVCTVGFALSFTICLIGVIFLLFLIVTFEKCRRPQIIFQPVYSLFKGFFKWTYIPLATYSLTYLISDIKLETRSNFIASIVILAYTVLFPIIQLIYYKVIQTESDNIWVKWFQFLSYMRQQAIVVILVLGYNLETDKQIAKYFVYGPLVAYALLHLWKGVYMYPIFERIMLGLGEAIAIVIFSLYLFDISHLKQYQLDFIGLCVILLLDICVIMARMIGWVCYGKNLGVVWNQVQVQNKVQPVNGIEVIQVNQQFQIKKKNKYDQSDDLQNSRDQLVSSGVKKTTGRRR